MFITAHTATDSPSFKASYLKGMDGNGGRRRKGFEGDLQLDWGRQQLAEAPSFATAWDSKEREEEDEDEMELKGRRNCFRITSGS